MIKNIKVLLILLLIPCSGYGQVVGGLSLTTKSPVGLININHIEYGGYAKVRFGNIKKGSLSLTETYIGAGLSWKPKNEKGNLLIGVGYYNISNIQGQNPNVNLDKLKPIGIDIGILVEFPKTPIWIYVNNDWVNWVLEIGVGINIFKFNKDKNKSFYKTL